MKRTVFEVTYHNIHTDEYETLPIMDFDHIMSPEEEAAFRLLFENDMPWSVRSLIRFLVHNEIDEFKNIKLTVEK